MPMQFESDAQRTVYEKVVQWLREIFGELATPREDIPGIWVHLPATSAWAQVTVMPWGDDATVMTRSYVVTGAELTPELLRHLLNQNTTMMFGAFGVDNDGDITFDHTIVGSTCDKEELRASVLAVVLTADKVDDELTQRWGGQRALDRTG
jgi:hypothetical protein